MHDRLRPRWRIGPEERRIVLEERRDERFPVLLPAGPRDHSSLEVHERRLEQRRFVLQPAAEGGRIVGVERDRQLTEHERFP
jgi:hypothetical protein